MLSVPHLIVIFVVALVIFGPEKLPELARNLGKVMAEFRRATGDLRSTFEGHLREIEREGEARRIRGTPSNAPAETEAPPAPRALGTVPGDPPNAAALAGGGVTSTPVDQFLPGMAPDSAAIDTTASTTPEVMPAYEPTVTSRADEPSPQPSESKKPERVNDGNSHPA